MSATPGQVRDLQVLYARLRALNSALSTAEDAYAQVQEENQRLRLQVAATMRAIDQDSKEALARERNRTARDFAHHDRDLRIVRRQLAYVLGRLTGLIDTFVEHDTITYLVAEVSALSDQEPPID